MHCEPPMLIPSITNAENDHITLISLDILQILHEEAFKTVRREMPFKFRSLALEKFNLIFDRVHLSDTKRNNAERAMRVLKEVLRDQVYDSLGFSGIVSLPSSVIDAVMNMNELDPERGMFVRRRWESHQAITVESVVRESD